MIITFTNPCPTGEMKESSFLNKSKLSFKTTKGDKIVSPYDGVVTESKFDKIKITHNINGLQFESILKNFGVYVGLGKKVREGDPVGLTYDGTFSFQVIPNVNAEELITIGIDTNKVKGIQTKETDKEIKKYGKEKESDNVLKMFFAPFDFVQGALNIEEGVDSINEEIKKIKKLF